MKITALSTLLCFALAAQAADKKPAPTANPAEKGAAKSEDLSTFKTADTLWAHLAELRKEPHVQPKSREEMIAIVQDWFGKQRAAADAFVQKYPADSRRWEAKMVGLQATMQLSQIPGGAAKVNADEVIKEIDTIVAAPDASADTKGEAEFVKTMMLSGKIDKDKPETAVAFLAAGDGFLEKYSAHKLAGEMRQFQIQVASGNDTPQTSAVLKKYAEGKDEKLASAAKEILAQREKMKELKTKPVALKFTATDGSEADLGKMRGKVVLVDFWASWCGPCIAEAPNVVATYKKLHDKGFEILGISLDQDKAAMEGALTKQGMTWPQFFDGKGWENSISKSFGITSIPAAWLIDKKGMLRETNLRGPELGAGVEKLLAE